MSSNSICNHTRDEQFGPRCVAVRFCYHSYDYRPNWTPLSPTTISNQPFFIAFLTLHNLNYLDCRDFFMFLLFVFIQDKSKSYLDQEDIKLSAIPSTPQANKQTADVFSAQNLIAGHEDGNFTTQQLFSFAWQIARGMVTFFTSFNIQLNHLYRETLNVNTRNWLDFVASSVSDTGQKK